MPAGLLHAQLWPVLAFNQHLQSRPAGGHAAQRLCQHLLCEHVIKRGQCAHTAWSGLHHHGAGGQSVSVLGEPINSKLTNLQLTILQGVNTLTQASAP